jgi:hypothetical protein
MHRHVRHVVAAAASLAVAAPGFTATGGHRPIAGPPMELIPYSNYTMMFAGTNGFRGLFPGTPEYQWHHTDANHSDIDWGTPNWPNAPTGANDLEHFSHAASGWIEISGWGTTTDGVTQESPIYTLHVTKETSGSTTLDTSDGQEKYSTVYVSPGESYSLQAFGTITQDNAPSVNLPFEHTMVWTVSADGKTLTQWEDWDQGTPLTEQPTYPRVNTLTEGQGFTHIQESNGWTNTESAYQTW